MLSQLILRVVSFFLVLALCVFNLAQANQDLEDSANAMMEEFLQSPIGKDFLEDRKALEEKVKKMLPHMRQALHAKIAKIKGELAEQEYLEAVEDFIREEAESQADQDLEKRALLLDEKFLEYLDEIYPSEEEVQSIIESTREELHEQIRQQTRLDRHKKKESNFESCLDLLKPTIH